MDKEKEETEKYRTPTKTEFVLITSAFLLVMIGLLLLATGVITIEQWDARPRIQRPF